MKQKWAILRWDSVTETARVTAFVDAEDAVDAMLQYPYHRATSLFARPAFDASLPDHYTKVRGFTDEP